MTQSRPHGTIVTIPERATRTAPLAPSLTSIIVPERTSSYGLRSTTSLVIPTRTTMTTTVVAQLVPSVPAPQPEPVVELRSSKVPVISPESIAVTPVIKRKLALLLPAHNEELIIAETIRTAIAAGQPIEDIYVVNDNSSDDTKNIATKALGEANVLNVERSGKALAVKKAVEHFGLEDHYLWLHIADADSIFSQDYFRHYTANLDENKYAVAVGFVQSLKGNWISTYRALSYTYSQHVTRRIQAKLGMISVFPGPITCFRTDIIRDLEFGNDSLTEDFDITLQVHRKKLGKILYIPKAVSFTQDPQTLADFCKQNMRWQRGFFQGVRKYRIGMHGQKIDASLGFQMFQTILFLLQVAVLLPLIIIATDSFMVIPFIIAADIIMNGIIAIIASVVAKRWNLLGALPYFFFLRGLEVAIYLIAFVEVMVLKKFNGQTVGWSTEGRRYKVSLNALAEVSR